VSTPPGAGAGAPDPSIGTDESGGYAASREDLLARAAQIREEAAAAFDAAITSAMEQRNYGESVVTAADAIEEQAAADRQAAGALAARIEAEAGE
jgi:hypothetical protein